MQQNCGGVLTWDEIGKAGIAAAVVSAVGALFLYFRSIGSKVDKTEMAAQLAALRAEFGKSLVEMRVESEKQIDAIHRRHSNWESRSDRFVTRELLDSLNTQIQKMEARQDEGFEKLNTRLDRLIEGRR